jgi:tRNA pseudouridine38-40 synthase
MSLPTRKLALVVEYDGERYHGFQVQAGVQTVQGEIERALRQVTGERIWIVGAGRTDAGVHARGQVVSFATSSSLEAGTMIKALNFYLAPDIAFRAGSVVDDSFDARRDAISREYRYAIVNSPTPSPLRRRYAGFMPLALDVDLMNEACDCLVGTHDFTSFAAPTERATVRDVTKAEVSRADDLVFFDMVANAFLHKQVRSTVGALIRVGLKKLPVDGFRGILRARRPGAAGPVAPARGLCLMRVEYPGDKFSRGQRDEDY